MTTFAFLHGGGQGSWAWEETIAALKLQTDGGVRACALDAPGCGVKRGRETSAIGVDDIADELVADLEIANFADVVLVGHSQAGSIMPRMALKRPELFRRFVYVSCSSPLPGKTILQMMDEEVRWAKQHSGQAFFRSAFCNDMREADIPAFAARHGGDNWPMQSYTFTDWRYEHLDAPPATYVVCLRDMILPVEWQEKFAQRLNASHIVRVDSGHQVMNTRPHALAEILRQEAERN